MTSIDNYSENTFESIKHYTDDGAEFWLARELQEVLEYKEWRNFMAIINKAKTSFEVSGGDVLYDFVDVNKIVNAGSSSKKIKDLQLSRYACYLIVQNGDPKKKAIALGQTYFAIQTRKQELDEEYLKLQTRLEAREKLKESEKEFSKNISERGVSKEGYGRIRSKGDKALFGKNTSEMKKHLGVKQNRALADFLPTVTIAAKNLATEMTNYNTTNKNLHGEPVITTEHVQNNYSVRGMLEERGIKPEELPTDEDIKKLERKIKPPDKLK